MKTKNVILIILATICSLIIVYFEGNNFKKGSPQLSYRVYLEGKEIGLIDSRDDLDTYINKQQEKLKSEYSVDKVYIPNNIDVVADITYDAKLNSINDIYDKISNISPFTIKGYEITIDSTNSTVYVNDDNVDNTKDKIVKIYVLDKNIFINAVKSIILSFVSEEEYEAFQKNKQLEIKSTGQSIENIYIDDGISIKETYIPVTETIHTDEKELTQYLIFNGHNNDQTYVVKNGDTIAEISSKNKMSVNELLIANSSIGSEKSLLYSGQSLTIGTLNPMFTTIVEKHVVTDQVVKYKTVYQYDNTKMLGYKKVIQEGVNGVTRVTQKVKLINGEISKAYITSSETITPAVDQIVVKGGRQIKKGDGEWTWPTNIPYIISSPYGWRWGTIHEGVDIIGTGSGSPIYAARDGIVTKLGWGPGTGYFIELKHSNGYYSHYLHLLNTAGNSSPGGTSSASKYAKIGQTIKAGSVIGDMGTSGNSTGTHLHFGIWDGVPYHANSYDPLLFY